MFRIFSHTPRLIHKIKQCKTLKRSFLSDAYKCTEAWENRLRAPIFQKIDFDDLYYQLDRSIQIGYRISVLDVDLFANGVKDDSFVGELGDVLYKLRLNPETGITYESTGHAAIRYHLAHGKKEELLNILSDRLNYGLFPDYYLTNLMLDKFLKQNDIVSATKVSTLQMLQEDFNHPITRALSLHVCLRYLNSPQVWARPAEPTPDPDDDEEVKVRVKFLRNPYFDDHFDIVDTNHLVGKTLNMCGQDVKNAIGLSCQIIGLVLHEKFGEVQMLLQNVLKENSAFYKEAITKAYQYLKEKPKQEEKSKDTSGGEGCNEEKTKLLEILQNVEKSVQLLDGNLEALSAEMVMQAVAEQQEKDIVNQCQLYKKWELEREEKIEEEIHEDKKKKVQAEIEDTKKQLTKEEDLIFFFDNKDKWNLLIESKENEKKNIKFYKEKHKAAVDDDYIPPQVSQSRTR